MSSGMMEMDENSSMADLERNVGRVVGVLGQRLEVAHAVVAGARREKRRGTPVRTARSIHRRCRRGLPGARRRPGLRRARARRRHNPRRRGPPTAREPLAVGAAVAGGAAVVDVDHREAAAGPELQAGLSAVEVEPSGRRGRSRARVAFAGKDS